MRCSLVWIEALINGGYVINPRAQMEFRFEGSWERTQFNGILVSDQRVLFRVNVRKDKVHLQVWRFLIFNDRGVFTTEREVRGIRCTLQERIKEYLFICRHDRPKSGAKRVRQSIEWLGLI